MRGNNGQEASAAASDADIKGMPEGEIMLRQNHEPICVLSSDVVGQIIGPRVNDDCLEIPVSLRLEPLEQAGEMLGLVESPNNDGGLRHGTSEERPEYPEAIGKWYSGAHARLLRGCCWRYAERSRHCHDVAARYLREAAL